MEEEYRMQKAQTQVQDQAPTTSTINGVIHEDGSVRDSTTLAEGEDDHASTRGLVSAPPTPRTAESGLAAESPIPVIRFSTESDRSMDETGLAKANGFAESNGDGGLEKPTQAAASDEQDGEAPPATSPTQEPYSFSNKRLCERWLDNLFMVLYEVC